MQKIKNNDSETVKLDLICEKDSNFVSNIIKALKENTTVKEIVLYKTSLDNESIKNLSSIINSNKITHLDLTNILLDKEEMESLRKLIENIKSTNLSTLTLWGNNFGDSGAEIITELFYSDSPIKYLNIGSNNIFKAGAEIIAHHIAAAKLIELNIGNNNIERGIINLLTALANNQYIKKLMLSNTGISAEDMEVVKEFLTTASIIELDLSENNLGGCTDKLGYALKQNKWLKSLNLSDTGLNHQNIEELTLALKKNDALETLEISDNHDIGNLGIKKIADMLLENDF